MTLINKNLKINFPFFFLMKTALIIFLSIILSSKTFRNVMRKINHINKISEYFACFCAKARKENKYARELVLYYSKIGVDKFIFGDNNYIGVEKLADVLQDFVDDGLVDIYEIFGSDIGQAEFTQNMYKKYNKKCNWFLFFDFDEYLEEHFEDNKPIRLQDFLKNNIFDKCESVLYNCLMYTDNDLIHYDNRTLLERFTTPNYGNNANHYVKSIVRGGLNKIIFYPKKSNHVPEQM